MKGSTMVVAALVAMTQLSASGQTATSTVFQATFDYYYVSLQGKVSRRERVSGVYTRDLQRQTDTWTHITMATGQGLEDFGPPAPRPTLDGFSYALRPAEVTSPGFFRSVPSATMQEKNLVFDTRMFENFGEEEFDQLTPNVPHPFRSNATVPLAGSGQFTNADVQLTLTGTTVRDGELCAIVDYRALFNHFELTLPQWTMRGRSHYWGQVWVALPQKRIQYATLYEDVLGDVTAGATAPQPTNVFRMGTLKRVAVR